jgi:hypothetical protein
MAIISVSDLTPPEGESARPTHACRDSIHAPCVASQATEPNTACWSSPSTESLLKVIIPFCVDEWTCTLVTYNLFDNFADIPSGFCNGFDMGVALLLTHTYTPPNHRSAMDNIKAIDQYISKEHTAHRYTGPFTQAQLQHLIGHFQTLPLGTIPKAGMGQLRMIQDFSYPHNNPHHNSVNSKIDTLSFPCEWGTFSEMVLLVMDAPPGAQVATLDVDAAF